MSNRKPGRGALPNGRSRTSTERYMILHYWMLESPAWQSLSPAARALYLVIRKHFNGHNNGQIHLSRDLLMHELGVGSEHTLATARDQLLERGFLKITSQGGFDYKAGARAGRAHTYELTELEMPGRPASKEFMSWRPAESLKQESFKGNRRVQKVHRTCAESAPVEPLTGAESAQPCAESAPVKPVFGHSTGAETAHIVILPCRDGRSEAQATLHSLSDSSLHGEAVSEALDEVKKGGRAKNRPNRLDGHLPAGKRGRHPVPVSDSPAPEIDLLRARGWTFAAIARRLGVHDQTIRGWRTGRLRPVPPARLVQLAQLLASADAAA